ncbi:MAG: hypothetical protein OEW00_14975, partial [candidate division Zixibacteria bacterium]|nr:hypothetical protein [candidate division Zixibacteria bacterium]
IQLLPGYLDVLDTATKKIVAVLDEMKQISPIDQKDFYSVSKALNIDDLIERRMSEMSQDSKWDSKIEIFVPD